MFFLVAWGCAFSCKNTTPAETGSPVAAAAKGPGKVKKAVRLKIPNYPLRTEKDLDVLLEEIQILHQLSPRNKLIFSKDIRDNKYMKRPVGHRAIGVVYTATGAPGELRSFHHPKAVRCFSVHRHVSGPAPTWHAANRKRATGRVPLGHLSADVPSCCAI